MSGFKHELTNAANSAKDGVAETAKVLEHLVTEGEQAIAHAAVRTEEAVHTGTEKLKHAAESVAHGAARVAHGAADKVKVAGERASRRADKRVK